MRRREFLSVLGGAAAAWPVAAHAQPDNKIVRVGWIGPGLDNNQSAPGFRTFVDELRKFGFTEGKNLIVEYRQSDQGTVQAQPTAEPGVGVWGCLGDRRAASCGQIGATERGPYVRVVGSHGSGAGYSSMKCPRCGEEMTCYISAPVGWPRQQRRLYFSCRCGMIAARNEEEHVGAPDQTADEAQGKSLA